MKFKELIQNADDAGATEIAFILDTRQHNTIKTFSPLYNKLQGPSLLSWNNSFFSENDLKGIISIGVGSKREDTTKIGRFGVGFNSVYHFTDAPQFISNNSDYVIFDPLCVHFADLEITNPGRRIKNIKKYFNQNNGSGLYNDVLSGFEVDGFKLDGSTMFRFPLRETHSSISTMTHTIKELEQIMKNFISSNDDILLFLKKVKYCFS